MKPITKRGASRPPGSLVRASAILATLAMVLAACGDADDAEGDDPADSETDDSETDDSETDDDAGTDDQDDEGVEDAAVLEPSEGDVELDIWIGRENYEPDQGWDAFTEKYPNITLNVDILPLETATTDFIRDAQAGNEPDIFQIESDLWRVLKASDTVRPLDDIFATWQEEDPELYDAMAPHAFGSGVADESAWLFDGHGNPQMLAYRVDWFEDAGLSHPPETWEDVLAAARELNTDDVKGYGMAFGRRGPRAEFWSHYMAMGGPIEQNMPVLTSEAGVYQCDFYRTIHEEDLISEESFAWSGGGDFRGEFLGERAAIGEGAPNAAARYSEALDYGTQWRMVPYPPREGAEDDWRHKITSVPYMVSANTEHPYEVGLFMRWMASPEVQETMSQRYVPTTNAQIITEYLPTQQPWWEDEDIQRTMYDPDVVGIIPSHENGLEIAEVLMDWLQACGQAGRDGEPSAEEVSAQFDAELDAFRE